ncbi:long-chain fatty acid--CoA ligase [Sporichthya brevicatena]|uniref:Long-chain fatty acid--CoA ligase n=1 Tax=Sporichthya brevicatena TaxID=171442 RepID=A0ABN1GYK9_9ACTN
MQLSDILHGSALKRPDHPALVSAGVQYTYAELSGRVRRLAAAVAATTSPGDRVAIVADNCVEYFDCLYGVPEGRAILTLVNQRLTAYEVDGILRDAEPRVLVVGAEHAERLSDIRSRVSSIERVVVLGKADPPAGLTPYDEFLALGSSAADSAGSSGPGAGDPERDAETAWLIYTSGTTGAPKGAMLTHRSLVSAMLNVMLEWHPSRDDRQLFSFPLSHVAAVMTLQYHLRQATVYLTAGFEPGAFLAAIAEHRITHTGLAPTMLNMVLAHPTIETADLSSLRMIAYGASSMPPDLLRRSMERFDVDFVQNFGQTEVSGNVLVLGPEEHRRAADGEPHLLAALGRNECLAAVRLVDDELNDVPVGEIGEIVVRGDQVMAGYWRNPEASAEVLAGGWLRTGDLARMDDEGLFYIVDRKKDMVVTGGENVYPREVEIVISALPGVSEVAVFGVPDETWGERVTAAVVARADAQVDAAAVLDHCRGRLAGFKIPKEVRIVGELPKNASMKVLKRVLREQTAQS